MVVQAVNNLAEICKGKRQFECQGCGRLFCLLDGNLICPGCASTNLGELVVVYKDDDPELAEYVTEEDINAGD